jgi:hypothetical protein
MQYALGNYGYSDDNPHTASLLPPLPLLLPMPLMVHQASVFSWGAAFLVVISFFVSSAIL